MRQVNNSIYTVWTNSFFPFAVAAMFALACAPSVIALYAAMVLGALSRMVTRVLLIFGSSLFEMQLMQVGGAGALSMAVPLSI